MTCHDFGAPTVWNNYGVLFKCHDRDQVLTKPELSSPLDSLAFLIRNIQTNFIYRYHPPDYNDVVKIPIGAFNIRVYELQRSGNFLGKCSSNNCLSPPLIPWIISFWISMLPVHIASTLVHRLPEDCKLQGLSSLMWHSWFHYQKYIITIIIQSVFPLFLTIFCYMPSLLA